MAVQNVERKTLELGQQAKAELNLPGTYKKTECSLEHLSRFSFIFDVVFFIITRSVLFYLPSYRPLFRRPKFNAGPFIAGLLIAPFF